MINKVIQTKKICVVLELGVDLVLILFPGEITFPEIHFSSMVEKTHQLRQYDGDLITLVYDSIVKSGYNPVDVVGEVTIPWSWCTKGHQVSLDTSFVEVSSTVDSLCGAQ